MSTSSLTFNQIRAMSEVFDDAEDALVFDGEPNVYQDIDANAPNYRPGHSMRLYVSAKSVTYVSGAIKRNRRD